VMRLLVSVRSVDEALAAAEAGVDLIDLKEPRDGALGALPLPVVRDIVGALHTSGRRQTISATVGDVHGTPPGKLLADAHALDHAGVDVVKVGIDRDADASPLLQALASSGLAIVPVFIADHGVDEELLERAQALPFPALMLDTADKRSGSLFDCVDEATLRRFIARTRRAGRLAGLAGALGLADVHQLLRLGPDVAGFRGAVCSAGRESALDPHKLQALRLRLVSASAQQQPSQAA
jgi:uncharacterized protein (UPF0264 family)